MWSVSYRCTGQGVVLSQPKTVSSTLISNHLVYRFVLKTDFLGTNFSGFMKHKFFLIGMHF